MKNLIPILLLISLQIPVCGQTPIIDSLDQLIQKATSDTARINLLIKKAHYLIEINLDTAISVSKQTIEESIRLQYKKGEANARIQLVSCYNFKGEYGDAVENLKIAENIFLSLQDSTGLGNVYSSYGMMYGMQSKYDSAIKYYGNAIQLAQRIHDNNLLHRAYQNISISYQMQSSFTQSLSYLQKALNYYEKIKDINSQAYTSLNMGLTYSVMGDTTRAEQSLLKSLKLSKAAGTRNVELYVYSNLASLYENNNYPQSYEFAMKAAQLGKEMGDPGIEAASLSKAVVALVNQNKLEEAEKIGQQAILTADASQQPYNTYQAYNAMGLVLKKQEKYQAAIVQFEKAFDAINEADIYSEGIGQSYFNLSECYSKIGDYQQALTAYKTSAEITDSVRSRENIRKATELNMNYEFEKKQQVAFAEQQRKNAETRTRQLVLSVGLVLTLIIALFAFYAFRTKQKANTLLQRQKKEIEKTLTELRITQNQLIQQEKLASLGELTAGIAHEIQNPLNFVNNFSEVSGELVEELKEEVQAGRTDEVLTIADGLTQNLEKIHHHGQRADSIVKSMLQHSRASSGERQLTDLNKLTDEYLRLSYHGLRAKDKEFNATLATDYDANLEKMEVIPQELGRVLLNLFNNAFYATEQKRKVGQDGYQPEVKVSTKVLGNTIEICIRDNGTGIPATVAEKIFQPFFTTKPTGEGTGLGLSLSYDIITKGHHGELSVETREGEYTEFMIQLPRAGTKR